MATDPQLYQAILNRRSVRRYQPDYLDATTLETVREQLVQAQPLVAQNQLRVLLRDVVAGEDLVAAMGTYGRVLSPPHFLLPSLLGKQRPLVDLGFRMQQLVVRLTVQDLGCCYIGTLGREAAIRARFSLIADAHIGAFLIFGRPATGGGQLINSVVRQVYGSAGRLPVEKLFFKESFENPAEPPKALAALTEAARHAPSALNVQPWRFLWRKGVLYIFTNADNPKYGKDPAQLYRFFDVGICMGNLAMAMEALSIPGKWHVYEGREPEIPPYPSTLLPIAKLEL